MVHDTLGVAVVFVGRVIVTVTVLIRLVDVLNVGGEDDECRDIGWSVRGIGDFSLQKAPVNVAFENALEACSRIRDSINLANAERSRHQEYRVPAMVLCVGICAASCYEGALPPSCEALYWTPKFDFVTKSLAPMSESRAADARVSSKWR